MSFLYSDKYLPGVGVFRLYSLLLLLRTTYFGMILNCLGETKVIFYSSILTLILNVMLNLIFFYLFGINGFAIASILSVCFVNILQLKITSNKLNIRFKNIMPWHNILNISVINLLFGMIFYLITKKSNLEYFFGDTMEMIILGTVWLFLYLILLYKSIKNTWNVLNR